MSDKISCSLHGLSIVENAEMRHLSKDFCAASVASGFQQIEERGAIDSFIPVADKHERIRRHRLDV